MLNTIKKNNHALLQNQLDKGAYHSSHGYRDGLSILMSVISDKLRKIFKYCKTKMNSRRKNIRIGPFSELHYCSSIWTLWAIIWTWCMASLLSTTLRYLPWKPLVTYILQLQLNRYLYRYNQAHNWINQPEGECCCFACIYASHAVNPLIVPLSLFK